MMKRLKLASILATCAASVLLTACTSASGPINYGRSASATPPQDYQQRPNYDSNGRYYDRKDGRYYDRKDGRRSSDNRGGIYDSYDARENQSPGLID
jgi:hypothetical protein